MFARVYSSEEDDEEIEMYDHDYDGPLAKSGKRHLGKTRWTREENRTDVQCQHRWQKVLNPELIKGPWTKEEDQRVRTHSSTHLHVCLKETH
uniref:V-myb avian myeloblastosis viral oncogene homolog n=1 Tax=Gadus morhua TaxID=8049 RepID=A0A8C5CAU5_GADMO